MACIDCRPQIAVLCQSSINSSLLEKYPVVFLHQQYTRKKNNDAVRNDLFGVYFGVLESHTLRFAKNGERFFRGEKGVRRVTVNRTHGFSGTETVPGKESFFLLGSAFVTGCRSRNY